MKHPASGAVQKNCPLQMSLSFFHAPTGSGAPRCAQKMRREIASGRYALTTPGWSADVFHTIEQTPADWDAAAPPDDIFLQRPFLSAIEYRAPEGMSFAYVVFYFHNRPAGIAYGQLLDLRIKKSLEAPLAADKGWQHSVKSFIAGLGHFQMLVCGNMLLTGEHGFYFQDENLEEPEIARLLDQSFQAVASSFRSRGRKVDLVMVKDIAPCCQGVSETLSNLGFCDFSFQPNMTLRLPPQWKTFNDYLEAMSSKYRIRARRAFKKRNGIVRRELNTQMTSIEAPAMYALYSEVAAHSDFNAFDLHPGYFTELKNTFPELFRVFGYYMDDELVGFCTTMRNGDALEAHFLGFKAAVNTQYQLYLNMLYDMVGTAIEEGVPELVFARTAMEIKSSVGAEAQPLDCRLRHYSPLFNRLMPFLIRLLEPAVEWTPRHPFREE